MNRLVFAAGLLAASTCVFAANPTTNPPSDSTTSAPSMSADAASASLPTAPVAQTYGTAGVTNSTAPDWKHNQPVFTMPMGGSYTMTDLTDVGGGIGSSLWGWYLAPTVQLTRHIGARFDLEQDFDTHTQYQQVRLLRATAGPEFTYPIPFLSKWTTPFVYTEGGATRISGPSDYIVWEATADAGLGLQVPITRRLGFQIIPADYSSFKQDNNKWIGDYSAKAGFVLNFYGNR